MFMVLVEGSQSRETKADVEGFFRTCAIISFFPTIQKAHKAIRKMESHANNSEIIVITLCKTL